jgi:cytochrome c-type protein NapC
MLPKKSMTPFIAALGLATVAVHPALAIDWASVPGKEVVLFYPGQSSLEWTLTNGDHDGAAKFKQGKNCKDCHADEENKMGPLVASGKVNEPQPIAGKPGIITATVKFAHDADTFYVHLDFAEGNQPDAKQDPKYATRVSFMLSDAGVPEAVRTGCWAACHDDLTGMASAKGASRTKYLGKSRSKISRQGGGDELKPTADLAKLKADGYSVELWEALLNAGSPATASAFTVLDKRDEVKAPVAAEANFANGTWSVTLSRKLHAGAPFKDIDAGKSYTVGLAIHAGHSTGRFHYVSIEQSLVRDQGSADFVAVSK